VRGVGPKPLRGERKAVAPSPGGTWPRLGADRGWFKMDVRREGVDGGGRDEGTSAAGAASAPHAAPGPCSSLSAAGAVKKRRPVRGAGVIARSADLTDRRKALPFAAVGGTAFSLSSVASVRRKSAMGSTGAGVSSWEVAIFARNSAGPASPRIAFTPQCIISASNVMAVSTEA